MKHALLLGAGQSHKGHGSSPPGGGRWDRAGELGGDGSRACVNLRYNSAANSSPPPCGEGLGVGVVRGGTASGWPNAVALTLAGAVALAIGSTAAPERAQAACSALSHHPCTPGFGSVLRHRSLAPGFGSVVRDHPFTSGFVNHKFGRVPFTSGVGGAFSHHPLAPGFDGGFRHHQLSPPQGFGSVFLLPPTPGFGSVFRRQPFTPYFCGVFSKPGCIPEIFYPLNQVPVLKVEGHVGPSEPLDRDHPADRLDEIGPLLSKCLELPPDEEARAGMQVTLKLAFKRNGELLAEPRFTYTTHEAPEEVKAAYHDAAINMLKRCTPLPISEGLGNAIAGRPFVIPIIETRKEKKAEITHDPKS